MDYAEKRAHHKLLLTPYSEKGLHRIEKACEAAFRPHANPHEGETWLCETGISYPRDLCGPGQCDKCDKEIAARYRSCVVSASHLDEEMIPRLLATVRELQRFLKAHRETINHYD